jgi:hypothetical protein
MRGQKNHTPYFFGNVEKKDFLLFRWKELQNLRIRPISVRCKQNNKFIIHSLSHKSECLQSQLCSKNKEGNSGQIGPFSNKTWDPVRKVPHLQGGFQRRITAATWETLAVLHGYHQHQGDNRSRWPEEALGFVTLPDECLAHESSQPTHENSRCLRP